MRSEVLNVLPEETCQTDAREKKMNRGRETAAVLCGTEVNLDFIIQTTLMSRFTI